MKKKECKHCLKHKELKEFNKRESYYLGVASYCRECEKQRVYDWRIKKYGNKKAQRKERKEKKERAAMIRRCEREYVKRYINPIRVKLRVRLKCALNQKTLTKKGSAVKMLGCSIDELKEHLEKQFVKGMTWENSGSKGWHIDHIIPLSSVGTEEEMIKLCHYSNLQPLWAADNYAKNDSIPILTNLHFRYNNILIYTL